MAALDEVRAQANTALAAGEHRKALSLARLMQRHFPLDFQTSRLLGKIYLETQNLEEAAEAFRTVVEVDPEDVVGWSALAIVAEEEGDLERALECFERALDIEPTNREVAAEVARIRSDSNLPRSLHPDSSMHSMARRFLAEGKFESAVPWLQEALRLSPDSTEVALALARALWQSWRPREAKEVALEVLARHPDCLRALAITAAAFYSAGDWESRSILEKTAGLNPGNDVARSFFEAAGLTFPEEPPIPEIPDAEVRDALSEASAEPELASRAIEEEAAEPGSHEVESHGLPEVEADRDVAAIEPEDSAAVANPLLRRLAALREASAAEGAAAEQLPDSSPVSGGPETRVGTPVGHEPEMDIPTEDHPPREEEPLGTDVVAPGQDSGQTAQDHINAGAGFADQGLLDEAVAEYRAALKQDPSVAQEVSEAVLALVETSPDNVKVRWLAGDALAVDGKFRRAVEQYLHVLKAATSDAASHQGAVPG